MDGRGTDADFLLPLGVPHFLHANPPGKPCLQPDAFLSRCQPTPSRSRPSPTATATATPIPPTETPTPTLVPTDTPIPPVIDNSFPPSQASISGVVGHAQLYSLDCEARSAVDLAAYFGYSIDEIEFLSQLPSSDDPDQGFVGSYTDPRGQIPPNSYGVHAGPVAQLLRAYGVNATDWKYMSYDQIQSEVASGRPVMVWVINNTLSGWPVQYTASDGNTTTVAAFEHTVIVVGYPRLHDPVGWRRVLPAYAPANSSIPVRPGQYGHYYHPLSGFQLP